MPGVRIEPGVALLLKAGLSSTYLCNQEVVDMSSVMALRPYSFNNNYCWICECPTPSTCVNSSLGTYTDRVGEWGGWADPLLGVFRFSELSMILRFSLVGL